jgi:acetolactate synthase-1/2/3 large subunit
MRASDYVINTLATEGVTHIFEVCGGALTHLLDSLYGRKDICTVSMHHEMAAAIAAEGYARAGGNLGVAMATSGPGATNLITGIGSCYFDSIPCVFITGQVNTYEYKFDRPVRQIGFQETDIVSIVKPITKLAVLVSNSDNLQQILSQAIYTAKNGRPGPVLLDLPMDIQRSNIEPEIPPINVEQKYSKSVEEENIVEIISIIIKSSRPVILAGGGVRSSHATEELHQFAQLTGIPVVSSLMGLDAYPHDDPLFIGMIGTYGNRYANLTVANADLLIALGTRLDTRQTGTLPATFARGAKKIHVDIDENELNNKIKVDIPLHMDIKEFLILLTSRLSYIDPNKYSSWYNRIKDYKSKYLPKYPIENNDINPCAFFSALSDSVPDDAIICVDVGQIQMWAAQTLEIRGNQRFLTQGGMASIGSALPMAIGASFARPGKKIIVITGDGGFQLNIQELQTVYHHNLPIKIIMLNNCGYGMIRQFQEQYFDGRFQSSVIGYSNPDFQDVVKAYKIPSERISSPEEIGSALKDLFKDNSPRFLEIPINEKFRVIPKLAVNMPIEEQEPLLQREELKYNMIIDILQEK